MKQSKKILITGIASVLAVTTFITSFIVRQNISKIDEPVEVGLLDSAMLRDGSEVPEGIVYFDEAAVNKVALSGAIPDDDPVLRGMVEQAIAEVNQIRAANGLDTLTENLELRSCSDVRAYECFQKFSHTRPNGSQWYTVNSEIMWGENLAYGYNNSDSVVNAWMNSPTHAYNILYPDFKTIAITVYVGDNGVYYWAQEFGK